MMPEHTGLTQLSLCCQALLPPSDNASLPSVLSRSSAHDPALDAGSLLSIHSPLHTTSKSFPLICFRAHIPICDCYSLSGKESTCKCKRCRFNPWVGESPGGGNGNPLQYPCLENPMDRGAWGTAVHRVAKSQTQLSN